MPAKMKGAIEEKVRITGECVASGKNDGQLALKYSVSCQQVASWIYVLRGKPACKTGADGERRAGHRARSWSRRRLRLSGSNTSCIFRKRRTSC
jgi:hypothetical protein